VAVTPHPKQTRFTLPLQQSSLIKTSCTSSERLVRPWSLSREVFMTVPRSTTFFPFCPRANGSRVSIVELFHSPDEVLAPELASHDVHPFFFSSRWSRFTFFFLLSISIFFSPCSWAEKTASPFVVGELSYEDSPIAFSYSPLYPFW